MTILNTNNNIDYIYQKDFNIQFLIPVASYVQWKLENEGWDDYNEFFHASRIIYQYIHAENVSLDSHIAQSNGEIIGCLFIVKGKINQWEDKYKIENEKKSLLLKYFHIADKGKGIGSYWLNHVILPYYKDQGFLNVYVNSSHPFSFPFYTRIGSKLTEYQTDSDNQLFQRKGKCFSIKIQ